MEGAEADEDLGRGQVGLPHQHNSRVSHKRGRKVHYLLPLCIHSEDTNSKVYLL